MIFRILLSLKCLDGIASLLDSRPPRLSIDFDPILELEKGKLARKDEYLIEGVSHKTYRHRPSELFPARTVTFQDNHFLPDFWEQSAVFCSKAARDAFDLPSDVVQYFPLNDDASSDEFRAKEYMIMDILACEDFIDLDRSSGLVWLRGGMSPASDHDSAIAVRHIQVKSAYLPIRPVFRAFNDQRMYASEEFAYRVSSMGLQGISVTNLETGEVL